MARFLQSLTHLPVRIGVQFDLNGVSSASLNDPAYAPSVGLILWKVKNDFNINRKETPNKPVGIWGSSPVKSFL